MLCAINEHLTRGAEVQTSGHLGPGILARPFDAVRAGAFERFEKPVRFIDQQEYTSQGSEPRPGQSRKRLRDAHHRQMWETVTKRYPIRDETHAATFIRHTDG